MPSFPQMPPANYRRFSTALIQISIRSGRPKDIEIYLRKDIEIYLRKDIEIYLG